MAKLRTLEKFEINAISVCQDLEFREKLKVWAQKKKEPLDLYGVQVPVVRHFKINSEIPFTVQYQCLCRNMPAGFQQSYHRRSVQVPRW